MALTHRIRGQARSYSLYAYNQTHRMRAQNQLQPAQTHRNRRMWDRLWPGRQQPSHREMAGE